MKLLSLAALLLTLAAATVDAEPRRTGDLPEFDSLSTVERWHRLSPFRLDRGDPREGEWLAALSRIRGDDISGLRGHRVSFPMSRRLDLTAALGDYRVPAGRAEVRRFDAMSVALRYRF